MMMMMMMSNSALASFCYDMAIKNLYSGYMCLLACPLMCLKLTCSIKTAMKKFMFQFRMI